MKTIYKFPLVIIGKQFVELPKGARIIHIGLDPSGKASLWAEVDTTEPKILRVVRIVGTGHSLPEAPAKHVGSFIDGDTVLHVYIYPEHVYPEE
jgi:hypothetical protein